jgi:hypothetical protein
MSLRWLWQFISIRQNKYTTMFGSCTPIVCLKVIHFQVESSENLNGISFLNLIKYAVGATFYNVNYRTNMFQRNLDEIVFQNFFI